MVSTLVSAAPGFDDPLGLIGACHGRIRGFCATLERLPAHLAEHGADAAAREAAAKILHYFDTAAVHHHEDEEKDLFPLVAARAQAEGRTHMVEFVAALKREHVDMATAWRGLRPLLQEIEAGRVPEGFDPLPFIAIYRDHAAREDDVLLPYAAEVLSQETLAPLGETMARRRGIS